MRMGLLLVFLAVTTLGAPPRVAADDGVTMDIGDDGSVHVTSGRGRRDQSRRNWTQVGVGVGLLVAGWGANLFASAFAGLCPPEIPHHARWGPLSRGRTVGRLPPGGRRSTRRPVDSARARAEGRRRQSLGRVAHHVGGHAAHRPHAAVDRAPSPHGRRPIRDSCARRRGDASGRSRLSRGRDRHPDVSAQLANALERAILETMSDTHQRLGEQKAEEAMEPGP